MPKPIAGHPRIKRRTARARKVRTPNRPNCRSGPGRSTSQATTDAARMKYALLILWWFLPWTARAAETDNPTPDAGGVAVEPSNGELEAGTVLTFTFPTSMVDVASIDAPNQTLPFKSQPELEGEFLWKSQTEGAFTIKRVNAGAAYHLSLAAGLSDLAHQPVQPQDWSADFKTKEFTVTANFEFRSGLSDQPQLPLETTYDVGLTDVAQHAYFQDRDSRQRYPVNVIQ